MALVALSLILPLLAVAVDAIVRAVRRSPEEAMRSAGWVLSRSLPFIGALLLTYALRVVGLVERRVSV